MRRQVKNGGLFYKSLKTLVLLFVLSGCTVLPIPPKTALCSYDNASKDDKSDKSPNFKCINHSETRFKINWNSPSADKMMCTPYQDWLKTNAYIKKVIHVFEKEYIRKTRSR